MIYITIGQTDFIMTYLSYSFLYSCENNYWSKVLAIYLNCPE